jgi:hypothetical protein
MFSFLGILHSISLPENTHVVPISYNGTAMDQGQNITHCTESFVSTQSSL